MSESKSEFQTIKLPGIALVDMYKNNLVSIDGEYVSDTSTTIAGSQKLSPQLAEAPAAKPAVAPKQQEAVPAIPIAATELTGPPYAVLGNFKKQVLVVLTDTTAVHCSEENFAFLSKVLAAVGLSLEHIALLNTHGKQISYEAIKAQFPASVAIYFGVEPVSIGVPMRFPQFQVQPWDGCSFLFAPSLSEINGASTSQTELKKELWTALKKIFN